MASVENPRGSIAINKNKPVTNRKKDVAEKLKPEQITQIQPQKLTLTLRSGKYPTRVVLKECSFLVCVEALGPICQPALDVLILTFCKNLDNSFFVLVSPVLTKQDFASRAFQLFNATKSVFYFF